MFEGISFIAHHIYDGLVNEGVTLPPLDGKAYQYLLAGNGVFIHAEDSRYSACIPVAETTVRGLPALTPFVRPRFPRIDRFTLSAITKDAQASKDTDGRLVEALYRFVLDGTNDDANTTNGGAVTLTKPPQIATPTSVTELSPSTLPHVQKPLGHSLLFKPLPKTSTPVLEIHSHGALPAYFSQTDNADEQGFMAYGVIGDLDKPTHSMRFRIGVYGVWYKIPLTTLFTAP